MDKRERAAEALNAIPTPADRGEWLRITMAYKAAGGDFDTWDAWSQRGEGYNQRENRNTWDSISPEGGTTAATLYAEARENGWTPSDPATPGETRQHPARPTRRNPATPGGTRPDPTRTARQNPPTPAQAQRIREDIAQYAQHRAEALPYLKSRGITEETAERFNLGFDPNRERLVIPYPGADFVVSRSTKIPPNGKGEAQADGTTERRYEYPAGIPKQLFNVPALNSGAEAVFVTEGQIDAITLEQAGAAAVGSNEAAEITDAISSHGTTAERFFIVPDVDENKAGDTKARKKLEALTAAGLKAYIYPLPAGFHDVNDLQIKAAPELYDWIREAPNFAAAIEAEQQAEYNARSGAALLDRFIEQWEAGRNTATPTGFSSLDKILDGGLFPGLYSIGAISSLGKTTFALQMADSIAAAGRDVLYFSLEQSAAELTAKTLSRLTALISQERTKDYQDALSTWDISCKSKRDFWKQTTRRQTVEEAARRYRAAIGPRLFIVEGVGDISADQIRQAVALHINRRGAAPVVYIDYVQILDAYGEHLTDKQNMDRNIVELKRISRDFNTAIVAISSFNRTSYTAKADLEAFKESGAVEYTSDCVIGIHPQGLKDGEREKVGAENRQIIRECKGAALRKLEAVVLKNRNGGTGTVLLEYLTPYNLYTDRGIKPKRKDTEQQTGKGLKF